MASTPTRHCEEADCGREVGEGRSDSRYCSNACRQRAYRRRASILKRYGTDSWDVLEALLSEHQQRVTDDARG